MLDFYSDTKTKPTKAMRQTVLDAVVGDEQKDEDPTTTALCERVADLLGKEAALFLPSGTMCNEIAIRVHIRPGDEIICERSCHIIGYEAGGPAALSGAMIHAIDGENGTFTGAQAHAAIRPKNRYLPISRLLCVEQTANLAGGYVWPLKQLEEVAATARDAGLATHMDGARLLNAVVQSGIPAAEMAAPFDTCWIDFTKGLGAPVGAMLAGSAEFIEAAWRLKQQMGGAMRQSGILAAMCSFALDHHVARLAEDHALAAQIAKRLARFQGVTQILPVMTNIVIFDVAKAGPTAAEIASSLKAKGILVGAFGEFRLRIVTHLDVDSAAGESLCDALSELLG